MAHFFKISIFTVLATTIFVACQTVAQTSDRNGVFQQDSKRNVLSFADTLEPVLPSVVRVGRLAKNADGELGLAGLGSGAVIDAARGYIITNAHVVNGGEGFAVTVPDGRVLDATLVGIDTPTDIAVLQADDLRVDAVSIANSDNLRVGDIVFAVGYPLGLDQSLSLGVVSGLGRANSGEGIQDFIQTDAAINSGNSGGPLLDSQGRLVGINTAIISRSGGSNGIGFSVPVSLATQVTDQLIKYGEVKRGTIGIQMARVSEEDSEKVGIDHWDGATVRQVRPGSVAEKAGLKAGDVITGFDSKTVKSPNSLRAWIGVAETDTTHRLTFIRKDGIEQRADVVITATTSEVVKGLQQLGAFIRPVRASDNIPSEVKGVYVSRIEADSPAESSGLMVGDIIVAINNEEADTMQDSDRLVNKSKGRARILIYRFGAVIPIFIEQ